MLQLERLPSALCQLRALQVLRLNYNQLHVLPANLVALTQLSLLGLTGNSALGPLAITASGKYARMTHRAL
jgi:hypothetical protein